jgi:hypothetical protein
VPIFETNRLIWGCLSPEHHNSIDDCNCHLKEPIQERHPCHEDVFCEHACESCVQKCYYCANEVELKSKKLAKSRKGIQLTTKSKVQILKLKELFSKNIEKNLKPQDVKELADSIGLSENKTYKWLWDHREQQERTQFKKIVKQLKKGEKIFKVTKVAH